MSAATAPAHRGAQGRAAALGGAGELGLAHMDKLDRAKARRMRPWDRLEAEDPDGEDEPAEQAELDRLLVDVDNLVDHGRWPRHLHWSF